jgi:hypothetical protein
VATIDWGDATTSAGTVSGSAGSYQVTGTHTYAGSGTFSVVVTFSDDPPGTATAQVTSTAHVASGLAVTAADFSTPGYIAMMKSHNHNFMRLWGWQQSAWAPWTPDKIVYEPTLYVRTGPGMALDGGLKFDLKKFNPVYFDRMRARVTECRERGIYCAVQLFQGFSYNRPNHCGKQTWSGHPYNSQNNINGANGDRNGDGQPDLDDAQVRELQAAYLKKIVDTVDDLDNVLYEVVNEGGGKDWDWWVVDQVHKYEASKGKNHPVGLTGWNAETLSEMLASPAEWISVGTDQGPEFKSDPPVWDGKKISVSDTDHLWGHGGTIAWAWKSFVRGHNTLLMDSGR